MTVTTPAIANSPARSRICDLSPPGLNQSLPLEHLECQRHTRAPHPKHYRKESCVIASLLPMTRSAHIRSHLASLSCRQIGPTSVVTADGRHSNG